MQDVRPPRRHPARGKRPSAKPLTAQSSRNPEAWQYAPVTPSLKMPPHDLLKGAPASLPARHNHRLIAGVAGGALVLTATAWVLGMVYGSHTLVGRQRLASRSNDTLYAQAFARQAAGYKLTVRYPDGGHKTYGLADLGVRVDTPASIAAARQAQAAWPGRLVWWRPLQAQAVVRSNGQTLDDFIAKETTIIAQPSRDATLSITDGRITVSDAVTGKQYGLNDSRATLLTNAEQLRSNTITLKELAVNPAVTAAALQPYKATLEKTLDQDISFTVQSGTVHAAPSDIANWLEITPHKNSAKLDITVNSGKVAAFMDTVTRAYVRPPKAKIVTAASAAQPAKVLVEGVNGSDVANKAAIASDLAAKLLNGTGSAHVLDVRFEPYKTITAQAYDKWIEVDLSSKRMYAYQKDQLVKTELVTAGAPATPTVTGQYKIYSKFAQQDMRGSNADGSGYYQPNVRWISYFYKDYAIHGNYWRPLSYFGNINSSHGCVSLVNAEAKWMYDWAPVGTPVIVHT